MICVNSNVELSHQLIKIYFLNILYEPSHISMMLGSPSRPTPIFEHPISVKNGGKTPPHSIVRSCGKVATTSAIVTGIIEID